MWEICLLGYPLGFEGPFGLFTVLGDHIASHIQIADECGDQQWMPIRRKAIWKNTLRCIASPTFVYNCGLNIVFIDEGAVDCGGPLRFGGYCRKLHQLVSIVLFLTR